MDDVAPLPRPAPGTRPPREAILIVNAMSRKGADVFEEARDKLVAAGVTLIDAIPVTEPEKMDGIVAEALTRAPMVIVGGGDGSLSTNCDPFVGTDTVFAILPLGTANSFAKTLGMPVEVDAAVDVIANGEVRRIDVGDIDGDYFVNAAALGLSPLIADTVPHKLKRYLGMVGYMLWAMKVALNFRPFRLKVTTGGRTDKVWATEVRIANGTHHGGIELVESAALDSGEMVVQAVTGKRLTSLAWSWFLTLFKLSGREQTVTEWRGKELRVETRPRLKISIDGEIAAKTPVTVKVAKGSLLVAAPREGQFS